MNRKGVRYLAIIYVVVTIVVACLVYLLVRNAEGKVHQHAQWLAFYSAKQDEAEQLEVLLRNIDADNPASLCRDVPGRLNRFLHDFDNPVVPPVSLFGLFTHSQVGSAAITDIRTSSSKLLRDVQEACTTHARSSLSPQDLEQIQRDVSAIDDALLMATVQQSASVKTTAEENQLLHLGLLVLATVVYLLLTFLLVVPAIRNINRQRKIKEDALAKEKQYTRDLAEKNRELEAAQSITLSNARNWKPANRACALL